MSARSMRMRWGVSMCVSMPMAGACAYTVAAEVIDDSFRGLNRVQQQRAVYAALKGKMDGSQGELHALALTTKAPD